MQYQLSRVVMGPVLHAFGRPRATGLENIPASGPAILASNHLSIIDSVYLPLMISRPVVFPAKAEYFSAKGPLGRLWAAYLRSTNQLAMNRDDTRSAQATLEAAAEILRGGRPVRLLPGGHQVAGRAAVPRPVGAGLAGAELRRPGDPGGDDRHQEDAAAGLAGAPPGQDRDQDRQAAWSSVTWRATLRPGPAASSPTR